MKANSLETLVSGSNDQVPDCFYHEHIHLDWSFYQVPILEAYRPLPPKKETAAGWWFQPLWKIYKNMTSSVGMMTFPIYGKSFKIPWFHGSSQHQPVSNCHFCQNGNAHVGWIISQYGPDGPGAPGGSPHRTKRLGMGATKLPVTHWMPLTWIGLDRGLLWRMVEFRKLSD